MKVSAAGLDLVKKHEGLRLEAYRCPAGVWTIGYGITSAAGVGTVARGMKITHDEAEDMLRRALRIFERGVQDALTRRPTQAQFDAMVSLAYNIGVGAFKRSSVLRHFNAGDMDKAAGAFLMWNKANGKVLPGLTRRRTEERQWFLKASPAVPSEPVPPTPKPAEPPPVVAPEAPPMPPPAEPGKQISWGIIGALAALFAAFAAWITTGG